MDKPINTIVEYTDASGFNPFASWHSSLRDREAARKIANKISRMKQGLVTDAPSVGAGVRELRINYGPGYRVYYGQRGEQIHILLCGGDKSTQEQDIKKAQAYWKDCKRRKQA